MKEGEEIKGGKGGRRGRNEIMRKKVEGKDRHKCKREGSEGD